MHREQYSPSMGRTPLHDEHVALGAKMVSFAGWDMPIQYSSIIDEHLTVRSACGAFDVSHMGDLIIRGEGSGELVERLMTNKVRTAPPGRCVYSHIPDEDGGILDDTIVAPLGPEEYFMVPNAATTSKIRAWIDGHRGACQLLDVSRDIATVAVQGPTAKDVVGELTSFDISALGSFWGAFVVLDRIDADGSDPATPLLSGRFPGDGDRGIRVYLSRTGYTGEDGFEIACENADAVVVWREVLGRGAPHGLKPIGLGARDTLRLEKGLLLSGTDFTGRQTSVQTGPSWVVDWSHEFIGRTAIERQRDSGDYDRLVGLAVEGRGVPRHGYDILVDDRKVGEVTSGTMSPVLKRGIAMGYVPLAHAKAGTRVSIRIRDSAVPAEVVRLPFVRRNTR